MAGELLWWRCVPSECFFSLNCFQIMVQILIVSHYIYIHLVLSEACLFSFFTSSLHFCSTSVIKVALKLFFRTYYQFLLDSLSNLISFTWCGLQTGFECPRLSRCSRSGALHGFCICGAQTGDPRLLLFLQSLLNECFVCRQVSQLVENIPLTDDGIHKVGVTYGQCFRA